MSAAAAWAEITEHYPAIKRPDATAVLPRFVRRPRPRSEQNELTAALLGAAPPGYGQLVRTTYLPVGLRDQIEAAEAQGAEIAGQLGSVSSAHVSVPDAVPDWLHIKSLQTLVDWIKGSGRTCTHSPVPIRPQPVFAAAWKPGMVVCARCTPLLGAVGAERFVCDACGRVCSDGEPMDELAVQMGIVMFFGGTCRDCRAVDDDGGTG